MRFSQLTAFFLAFAAASLLSWPARCPAADNFREHVAPILQRRCLSCHDHAQSKGDFSLETADRALGDGFIEPGDADASHLLEVITPVNGKARMPKNADPLRAAEIAAIRKWIDAGAVWPDKMVLQQPVVTDYDWWSYQPLRRPPAPKLAASEQRWLRNPLDAFVLRKLQQQGLTPAAPADRRTLIRRVTYDLIGLPPTPEEVEAFVNDSAADAYERLVDRLLDSQQYGERWARHWLDIVKYADTCGYDKDKLRPHAWPYRDYVIRSLNADKPYARFVQEQIAGDVLFPATAEGILGLGFLAAGPWDFIGHVEVPESKIDGKVARNLDRDDMVCNTLNTFCSLTIQCARCHNHKFDPITQRDYYGLQAIFAAVDRADRPFDADPQQARRRQQLQAQLDALRSQQQALDREVAAAGGPRLAEWKQRIPLLQSQMKLRKDAAFGYHSAIASSSATEKWVAADLGREVPLRTIVLRPCHDEFAGIGAGFGFPLRFRVEVSRDGQAWTTIRDATNQDVPNPGLTPVHVPTNGAPVRHIRLTATRLVERKNDYILALAELEALDSDGDNTARNARVTALDSIEAPVRWAKGNLTDGRWAQGGDPAGVQQLDEAIRQRDEILAAVETPQIQQRREQIQRAIKQAEAQAKSLAPAQMVYAAAVDFSPQGNFKPTGGTPRPIWVLHRGEVQQPLAPAEPRLLPLGPDSASPIDARLPEAQLLPDAQRRAALARWLTDRQHPLVWRSIVNRVWQYHFGQGIVATPNDFGRMGAKPTHPQLLDWLAVEFRDGGQSLKQLHRLMVTSSVYRQSSRHNEAHAAVDGGNQFLWRMNRRRLEAEEIRDSILAVSGTLNPQAGGPGFYLFALEKTAHSPHYEYHKFDPADPKSHRRSIYRFIVRSQPDPWMSTLDCADSSQSTPRRNETLTALQALSLLNNRFNLLMAERFAERLRQPSGDLSQQIRRAMSLAVQRPPTAEEQQELQRYAEEHGLPNLCRLLFNLSEFVYLD